ncbi:MAG TPA: ABC transporter permease [Bryobacteraceae bacterium]|nr:ABC transporter permease [Bryobacteraceae bacterium]
MKEIWRKARHFFHQSGFDREMADEMQFHLEARADELVKTGLPRADALAQARREFGPTLRMQENSRAAWQIRWLEDLLADMRYAGRAFRRNPGFALAAIFSLALGAGANTTMFSLTMEFLFSQPSCRNPETLASMRIGGNSDIEFSKYRFLRDAHLFESLAGSNVESEANWRWGTETYRLNVMRVTDNFFTTVGVPVAIGRGIEPGDRDVVVLSDRLWRSRLASNPAIVGRVLVVDGRPHTVVGILPRDHRTVLGFGFSPDLYVTVSHENDLVALIARLPEGMTRQVARGRLVSASKELDQIDRHGWSHNVEVTPVAGVDRLRSLEIAPFTAFFGMLMIVVGLVLLIACANVSSLLLARASSRRQELAVRLAIGAARTRIVRQLLAESLLLALAGTATGLLINFWLTGVMNRVELPLPIPMQLLIQPDWRLLLYSTLIATGSALAAGLMPALKATRGVLNAALKLEERQIGSRWVLRNALVVGQIAITVVLLATGFLFVRNMTKAMTMSPGFDVRHTAWAYMRLVPDHYSNPDKIRRLVVNALRELRAVPGIEAASIARAVPLNDHVTIGTSVLTDLNDRPVHAEFNYNRVAPDYFRTMGIPILDGREFLASDRDGAPAVAIINETMARRLFGDRNPVGHTIRTTFPQPVTVVGLSKDSKYFTLGEENSLALYSPYFQTGDSIVNLHFLVRAAQPRSVLKSVSAALGRLDPSAAVEVKTMGNSLAFAFLPSRVGAALLGSMGILGLALASIGLYGVLAYAVSRRIREIGLRIALGAGQADIVRMVLRESLLLVALGVGIGLALAVFATRPLALFLVPDLSTTDPATFGAVVAVLAGVAFAATLGPALRALRVDPMTALRYE